MCKGRGVWTEIKDFIEFDLRGKFRGGEYIIKVTTSEGITTLEILRFATRFEKSG